MPTLICTKLNFADTFKCKEFNNFKKASEYFTNVSYISNNEKVIFEIPSFLPLFLKNLLIQYKLSKNIIKFKLIN